MTATLHNWCDLVTEPSLRESSHPKQNKTTLHDETGFAFSIKFYSFHDECWVSKCSSQPASLTTYRRRQMSNLEDIKAKRDVEYRWVEGQRLQACLLEHGQQRLWTQAHKLVGHLTTGWCILLGLFGQPAPHQAGFSLPRTPHGVTPDVASVVLQQLALLVVLQAQQPVNLRHKSWGWFFSSLRPICQSETQTMRVILQQLAFLVLQAQQPIDPRQNWWKWFSSSLHFLSQAQQPINLRQNWWGWFFKQLALLVLQPSSQPNRLAVKQLWTTHAFDAKGGLGQQTDSTSTQNITTLLLLLRILQQGERTFWLFDTNR